MIKALNWDFGELGAPLDLDVEQLCDIGQRVASLPASVSIIDRIVIFPLSPFSVHTAFFLRQGHYTKL